MPTILTYGDSNTHGTPPTPSADLYLRLGPEDRWPCVMQRALGPDCTLIEEGLPGRTTVFNDPVTGPTMNGLLGLPMALRSHGPIDWLTIMLGTNDCQIHHGATAEQIAGGLAALLALALSPEMQTRHDGFLLAAEQIGHQQGTECGAANANAPLRPRTGFRQWRAEG